MFSNHSNHTIPDLSVEFPANLVVTSFALLVFGVIFLLVIIGNKQSISDNKDSIENKQGHPLLTSTTNIVVLFLGLLTAVLTTLSASPHETIYTVYRVAMHVVIGIAATVYGDRYLFVPPSNASSVRPIGHNDKNMSFIIWVITIPLVLLELFESIAAMSYRVDVCLVVVKMASLLQKIIQASTYHFSLRHKVPNPDKEVRACWYLKTLSLFNFLFWLESIVTEKTYDEHKALDEILGNGISIITSACDALMIDYRLLCCFLFAEHALEMAGSSDDGPQADRTQQAALRQHSRMRQEENNARQHLLHPQINPVSAHLGNSSIPYTRHFDDEYRSTQAFAIQVSQMSGFGYSFGFLMIGLQLISALQYTELVAAWSNCFPILANLMIIIIGVILIKQESFFLIPALMLSVLSVFVTSVIDGFNGKVEKLIEDAHLNPVLNTFLECGAPIHLGFALHLSLHFYIVNNNLQQHKRDQLTQRALTGHSNNTVSAVVESQSVLDVVVKPRTRSAPIC